MPHDLAKVAQASSILVARSGAARASNRRAWRESERPRRGAWRVQRSVIRPLTLGHHAYADRAHDLVVNCGCNPLDDGAIPSGLSARASDSRTAAF